MDIEKLRKEVRKRLEAKRKERERYIQPDPPPLYDEVFFKGCEELFGSEGIQEWLENES